MVSERGKSRKKNHLVTLRFRYWELLPKKVLEAAYLSFKSRRQIVQRGAKQIGRYLESKILSAPV